MRESIPQCAGRDSGGERQTERSPVRNKGRFDSRQRKAWRGAGHLFGGDDPVPGRSGDSGPERTSFAAFLGRV